jgi:hypothetical protein
MHTMVSLGPSIPGSLCRSAKLRQQVLASGGDPVPAQDWVLGLEQVAVCLSASQYAGIQVRELKDCVAAAHDLLVCYALMQAGARVGSAE